MKPQALHPTSCPIPIRGTPAPEGLGGTSWKCLIPDVLLNNARAFPFHLHLSCHHLSPPVSPPISPPQTFAALPGPLGLAHRPQQHLPITRPSYSKASPSPDFSFPVRTLPSSQPPACSLGRLHNLSSLSPASLASMPHSQSHHLTWLQGRLFAPFPQRCLSHWPSCSSSEWLPFCSLSPSFQTDALSSGLFSGLSTVTYPQPQAGSCSVLHAPSRKGTLLLQPVHGSAGLPQTPRHPEGSQDVRRA